MWNKDTKKGEIYMITTQNNNITTNEQIEDVCEMIELMRTLTYGEKCEIKGIIIGMQMKLNSYQPRKPPKQIV